MNRKYSLKKSHDIDKLVKNKRSVGNKYYAIYYVSSLEKLPQIAISASKKFKTAVKKNYEKRVVKEILRPNLDLMEYLKVLIIIKNTVEGLDFNQKQDQLLYLVKKINKEK